jgi:hypothetical protein
MDYEDLQQKEQALKERHNTRQLRNYHYARGLGFSSQEATLLMGNSRARIAEIAKERDNSGSAE